METKNLPDLWRDVRHAVRRLRRSPVFTAAAVATLALGIGGTTAVVTIVDQVMLRSLPVARPDALLRIGDATRCCYATGYAQNDWSFFSHEAYEHFRANTPAFQDLAALQVGQAELAMRRTGSNAFVEPRVGEYVSGNFFRTFGVPASRGRLFVDDDDRSGAAPVAVMSYHTWQDAYGSDSSVVGATYDINGHMFTIIGVAAADFFGAKLAGSGMPDFWLPLSTEPLIAGATSRLGNPGIAWLDLIGRVRADAQTTVLGVQLQRELRDWLASHETDMTAQERAAQPRQVVHVSPGNAGVSLLREDYRDGLRLLLFAAACVLFIACANVANLLLARGMREAHQTALRTALGASRARLVRTALIDSLVLSLIAAAMGIAVAYAGAGLIVRLVFTTPGAWMPVHASPSISVILFAIAISVITGLVFGIAPALMTSRADPVDALHGASRSIRGTRAWAQKTMVVAQVALSLILLSAASMLGRSLRNLEQRNLGFDTTGRYLVSINSMLSSYSTEQIDPLFREIESRLRTVPGVRAASATLYAPMSGLSWSHAIRIDGKPELESADDASSSWTRVTPGFFESIGDPIVSGRAITEQDNATSQHVAVINESFARKYFGRANPIGKRFGPGSQKNARLYEIVGVAADVRYFAEDRDAASPMYFVPLSQTAHFDDARLETREIWSHHPYDIIIWAPGQPHNIDAAVKQVLSDVAPGVVLDGVRPYSSIIRARFAQQDMIASLTWLFGAIALMLATVGLYGVIAYGVQQRTTEIGVRMALGAQRVSIVAMVLRGAFSQVGIGVLLGVPAAVAAGQLMTGFLFGVAPWDPILLSVSIVLLATAAGIASSIPARRAASVSPIQALRAD